MPKAAPTVLASGLVLLAACAVGTVETSGDLGTGGDGGGSATDATSPGSDGGHGHSDGSATGADAGGSDLDGGAGNDGGGLDGGGGTDSGGTDGGGTTIPCDSTNVCTGAMALGTISGDTSSADVSASGTTSKWFTLNATENDSGPFGVPMKLHVTLTSPGTENFDLYVYRGGAVGQTECTTVNQSSTNGPGQADTVAMTWGETGTLANGADDSRTVTIEVRAASTPCDSTASWSLTVHGH